MENKQIRKISNTSSIMLLIFAGLIFIFTLALSLYGFIAGPRAISRNSDVFILISFVYQFVFAGSVSMLVFYLIRRRSTGLSLGQLFCKPKMSAGWVIKWIIIGISMTYLANYANLLFEFLLNKVTGIELPEVELNFGSDSPLGMFTTVLAVSILAPVFEELMFRGTVLRNNEVLGQKFAIFTSALFFGMYHMNHRQIFYAFVLGLFAGFLFVKTRSIFPSIIMHFVLNSISTAGMLISSNLDIAPEKLLEALKSNPAAVAAITFLGLMIMCILISGIVLIIAEFARRSSREKLRLRKGIFNISTGKKALVYFTAPATIVLLLYLIFMTAMSTLSYSAM